MSRPLRPILVLALVSALAAGTLAAPVAGAQENKHTAVGTGGAIATVEVLASRAGMRILRKGGNATDAAVAAAAVIGVTEPVSAGIGGGGFLVI